MRNLGVTNSCIHWPNVHYRKSVTSLTFDVICCTISTVVNSVVSKKEKSDTLVLELGLVVAHYGADRPIVAVRTIQQLLAADKPCIGSLLINSHHLSEVD